jgi:hypothetical protein
MGSIQNGFGDRLKSDFEDENEDDIVVLNT